MNHRWSPQPLTHSDSHRCGGSFKFLFWGLCLFTAFSGGCDFLKIKEESSQPVVTNPTPPPPPPVEQPKPTPPPAPPVEPPEKIAERVIKAFQAKQKIDREDKDILSLADLHEPARQEILELDLENSKVTGRGLKALDKFPNLKALRLGLVNTLDRGGLDEILKCKTIETLTLDRMPIDDQFVAKLAGMKSIKDLQITETQISEKAVAVLLKGLDQLERVLLSGIPNITGRCFQYVSSKKLAIVFVDRSGVDQVGMGYIARLPLTHLSCVSCYRIGDKGVSRLGAAKNLIYVNFSYNGDTITNLSMITFGKIKTLQELYLSDCKRINDTGLAKLKSLRNLKTLALNGTLCSPGGFKVIAGLNPGLRGGAGQ